MFALCGTSLTSAGWVNPSRKTFRTRRTSFQGEPTVARPENDLPTCRSPVDRATTSSLGLPSAAGPFALQPSFQMGSPPSLNRSKSAPNRRSDGPNPPEAPPLPPTSSAAVAAAREPRTVLESFVIDGGGGESSSAYSSGTDRGGVGGQGSPRYPTTPTLYNRTPLTPQFPQSGFGGGQGPSTSPSGATSYFPTVTHEAEERYAARTYDVDLKEEASSSSSSSSLLSSSKGLGPPGTNLNGPRSFQDREAFWLTIYFVFNVSAGAAGRY